MPTRWHRNRGIPLEQDGWTLDGLSWRHRFAPEVLGRHLYKDALISPRSDGLRQKRLLAVFVTSRSSVEARSRSSCCDTQIDDFDRVTGLPSVFSLMHGMER